MRKERENEAMSVKLEEYNEELWPENETLPEVEDLLRQLVDSPVGSQVRENTKNKCSFSGRSTKVLGLPPVINCSKWKYLKKILTYIK